MWLVLKGEGEGEGGIWAHEPAMQATVHWAIKHKNVPNNDRMILLIIIVTKYNLYFQFSFCLQIICLFSYFRLKNAY